VCKLFHNLAKSVAVVDLPLGGSSSPLLSQQIGLNRYMGILFRLATLEKEPQDQQELGLEFWRLLLMFFGPGASCLDALILLSIIIHKYSDVL